MSRSAEPSESLPRLALPWLGAGLALTLAIGAGVLLAELLMSPPRGELRDLSTYLALSGVATLGGGWLLLKSADRWLPLSIRNKAFLSSALAAGVALLNVVIVAQLMFVSTSHDLKVLVALTGFSAVVAVFFSLWIATTVSARVRDVAAAVRSLAAGDLSVRVDAGSRDEVARLAADVNTLATRLQAAAEQRDALDRERKELTTAISHDLRTPLASLRAMVEALADRVVVDPLEVERYYATMRREIERLSRMLDDLFELAQIDAGALRLSLQPVQLHEIAADVVDAMQAGARLAGVHLSLQAADSIPLTSLDGSRIERAVSNLLRNAIEHTPPAGEVRVLIGAEGGWVDLLVCDTGEGIDPADLPHIWDRFYRAEKSRRRDAGGSDGAGLGLAIVRGIVEAHGGSVTVESQPGRGATFALRLPVR